MEDVFQTVYEYLPTEKTKYYGLTTTTQSRRNIHEILRAPTKESEIVRVINDGKRGLFVAAGLETIDRSKNRSETEYVERAKKSENRAYAFTVVEYLEVGKSDVFFAQTRDNVNKFYNNLRDDAIWHNHFFTQIRNDFKEPRYGFNRISHLPVTSDTFYQPFSVTVDARSRLEILKYRCAVFGIEPHTVLDIVAEEMLLTAEQLEGLSRACYVMMQALCLHLPFDTLKESLIVVETAKEGGILAPNMVDQQLVDELLEKCVEKLKLEDEMLTMSDITALVDPVRYDLIKKLQTAGILKTALNNYQLTLLSFSDDSFVKRYPDNQWIRRLIVANQAQNVTKLALVYYNSYTIEADTYFAQNPTYMAILDEL